MNPIKRKVISAQAAKELNISEEVVDAIMANYYEYIRINLSAVTHTHIFLPNLGTFSVKPASLASKIKHIRAYLKKLSHPKTLPAYAQRREHVRRVEHLEQVQQDINEEYSQKHIKRVKRYEVINANKELT